MRRIPCLKKERLYPDFKESQKARKRARNLHYAGNRNGSAPSGFVRFFCVGKRWISGPVRKLWKRRDCNRFNAETGNPDSEENAEAAALSADAEAQDVHVEEAEKQAVVDSYQNLGLVQVSGYLNVRETPGSDGKIIGKLEQNSACEILGTEGDWDHISSGGIEGYIHNQYVISGDEARKKALDYVTKMAIVETEKLNIRQDPVLDPTNVVGQALANERYVVEEELEGWVKIPDGYISADYVTVGLALNEARKLDLKAMALNQYDNLLISKVDNYLNIRKEPSTDSSAKHHRQVAE